MDVPSTDVIAGIQGTASSSTIESMAQSVKSGNLGGMMVWYASVYDETRGHKAFAYGSDDASQTQDSAWQNAMKTMNS